MWGWGPATPIYLAAEVTELRKGFERLYGLVSDRLDNSEEDPVPSYERSPQ